MRRRTLPTISLFSGAMGLDLGLEQAGFDIRAAVECNRFAAETIRMNRPRIGLIQREIEQVSTAEILKTAGLMKGEPILLAGGVCCQSFSTAGQRASLGDPRGRLVQEFIRVVREARPRFFVIENVRGMLSAAVKHRPLAERGPGFRRLTRKEQLGSGFLQVIEELKETGYYVIFDLVNAADYGVPQTRERLLFIGSRDGEELAMPEATHAERATNGRAPWRTLREALADLRDLAPEHTRIPPAWCRFMKDVPPGGNWRDLPGKLHKLALGSAFVSWGGRSGFFRRLAWERPAPSLTTRPSSKATLLCHPDELRPLSVAEYARIQQFPDTWVFAGGTPQKYKQIGNAVPVSLGRAVGMAIRKTMRKRRRTPNTGVVCLNASLIARLVKRPKTILNPPRMRKSKDPSRTENWLHGLSRSRPELLQLLLCGSNGQNTTNDRV